MQTHISTRFFADARILVVRARFSRFPPKEHPIAHQRAQKKNERVNPLSKKKGNSRYFYPRQHELMVTYAFFFEPFFPFESLLFFPTAIMYVRVKTMQAGGGVQSRQFFFSLFFFREDGPAQVANPQTSSFFRFLFNSDRILSILLFGA